MKKPKLNKDASIAEILHHAADYYLWDGGNKRCNTAAYSCVAILELLGDSHIGFKTSDCLFDGIADLGLEIHSMVAFEEFEFGEERQAVRYAWLKFCAMLAEEQGV